MVPRHLCSSHEMLARLDREHLPNLNISHFGQIYPNPVGGGPAEGGGQAEGGFRAFAHQPPTTRNPWPSSDGYVFNENGKVFHDQHNAPFPSFAPHAYSSSVPLPFRKASESHGYVPSSSQHVSDGSFVHFMASDGVDLRKRKWPLMQSVYERGSTSSSHADGGSSIYPSLEYLSAGKNASVNADRQSGCLLEAEGFRRNVRTRYGFDLEPSYGSYLSSSAVGHQHLGHHFYDFSRYDSMGKYFHPGSSCGAYDSHYDHFSGRGGFLSHGAVGLSEHSARGVHDSCCYQPHHLQNYEASSSSRSLQFRTEMPSNEAWKQQREIANRNWHENGIGRSNISSQRSSSVDPDAPPHGRFQSEGFMIIDRPLFFGTQGVFDPHRDMRMDIDNMSYEDLLALGERMGSVQTGLSEGEISSCLKEALCCCWVNKCEEKQACAICLEEYRVLEDVVGTVKACGHYYHVSCITKWLSMKNSCPICKVAALPHPINC